MSLKAQTPAPGSGVSRKCLRGVRRDCDLRSSVCIGRMPPSWSSCWSGCPWPRPQPPLLRGGEGGCGGEGAGGRVSGAFGLDRVTRTADSLCLAFYFLR